MAGGQRPPYVSPRRGARSNSEEPHKALGPVRDATAGGALVARGKPQIPTDRIALASTGTVATFSPAMFSRESDTM